MIKQEEIKKSKIVNCTFIEAIKHMKCGLTMKRSNNASIMGYYYDPFDQNIHCNGGTFKSVDTHRDVFFTSDDIMATDWEEVGNLSEILADNNYNKENDNE